MLLSKKGTYRRDLFGGESHGVGFEHVELVVGNPIGYTHR